jgi:hypothetical protein
VDAAQQQRARAPEHGDSPEEGPFPAVGPFPLAHPAAELAPQPAHTAAYGDDGASDADMEDADDVQSWGEPVPLGHLALWAALAGSTKEHAIDLCD